MKHIKYFEKVYVKDTIKRDLQDILLFLQDSGFSCEVSMYLNGLGQISYIVNIRKFAGRNRFTSFGYNEIEDVINHCKQYMSNIGYSNSHDDFYKSEVNSKFSIHFSPINKNI